MLREMEYQAGFYINSVIAIGWFGAALVSMHLFFIHTNSIAGWTKPQVFLLLGIYRVVEAIANATFRVNFEGLPHLIQSGDLDLLLVKPIPTQLLLSFRQLRIFELPNVLVACCIIGYSLVQLSAVSLIHIVTGTLFVGVGVVIIYALWFAIAQVSFWSTKMSSLWQVFNMTHTPAIMPIQVYEGVVRLILTIAIPVAFVTTVPAQVFLGTVDWGFALMGVCLAVIFLVGSNQLFHFALKRYASASS